MKFEKYALNMSSALVNMIWKDSRKALETLSNEWTHDRLVHLQVHMEATYFELLCLRRENFTNHLKALFFLSWLQNFTTHIFNKMLIHGLKTNRMHLFTKNGTLNMWYQRFSKRSNLIKYSYSTLWFLGNKIPIT